MSEDIIALGGKKKSMFIDKVKEILPDGGNLNLCLTCGACSSGCPATGLEDMDPRKFLRMAALGMDDELLNSDWAWMCTLCMRCIYVCPMKIDIPQLVFNARAQVPREDRPKGILGSCDMALRNESGSAMGTSPEDFKFVVEDVLQALELQDLDFRVAVGELGDPQTYRRLKTEDTALVVANVEDMMNTNIAFTVREISQTVPIVANADLDDSVDILEKVKEAFLTQRMGGGIGQLDQLGVIFDERGAQIQVADKVEQALIPSLGRGFSQQGPADLPMQGR